MSQAERKQRRRAEQVHREALLHEAARQGQRIQLTPEQRQVFEALVEEHGRRLVMVSQHLERLIVMSRAGFNVSEGLEELRRRIDAVARIQGELVKPDPVPAAEES